jgi:hypothetical protein
MIATEAVSLFRLRKALVEQINEMAERVDAIFLGYGFFQSLQGIDDECSVPVILPQVDDCISLLLSPEVGFEMVIKELHLDRVIKYGKDPMEMASRLFTHYRCGLFIDTGVGEQAASESCKKILRRLQPDS